MCSSDLLQLLSLPRTLGTYQDDVITVQNGRYGPYMKHGADSRTLTSEDQLFSIGLEEAIEIYNEIALQEVKTIVDKLVQEGLMEVKSYGENGEPKFGLTELGEKCAESLKEKMDRKI